MEGGKMKDRKEFFSMRCVSCGKNLSEGGKLLQRKTRDELIKSAKKQGWKKVEGFWFCKECKKKGFQRSRLEIWGEAQRNRSMIKLLEQQLVNLIKDSQEAISHVNKRLVNHSHNSLTGKIYFPDGKKKSNLIIGVNDVKEEN